MKRNFITLLVVLFILGMTGCAAKMDVLSDNGAKEPTYVYQAKNIPTGITIQSYVAGMAGQDDSGYSYPEDYLDINEPNSTYVIEKRLIGMLSRIRVVNPYGIAYEVKVRYKMYQYEDEFPHVTSYVLYQGDEEEKVLEYWRRLDHSKFSTTHDIIVSRLNDQQNVELFALQTKYKR